MALPVTVPLHPEETMLSFASRFARVNGIGRLATLCEHLGLDLNGLTHGDEDQIRRLADFGGVDFRDLTGRVFLFSGDGFVSYGPERLALSSIHRRRLRACPLCLEEDRKAGSAPVSRPLWALVHARHCPGHGAELVDPIERVIPNDFAASWHDHRPCIISDTRPAFEVWAVARLSGKRRKSWIDSLDIDVVGACAEMIGASLLFGKNTGVKECDETQLARAVAAGFAVLADGEPAVLKFFETLRYGEGADQDKPQGRYGRIHDWLKRGGGSTARFEPVRAILRNHILATWALDSNDLALDEKVKERRFHNLQSAAKALGVHPKRLGKLLAAEGHLDLSKSGPDRLIPAWVIAAMRDTAFEDAGFGEATELLGISKFTIETLLEAGIIRHKTTGVNLRPRLERASIQAFSSWIATLPEGDGRTGYDVRAVCRLFRMTASDVLRLAWAGNLPRTSRLIGRVDYHAIRIVAEDIEIASGEQLRPMLDHHQVARKLGISLAFLTRVVKEGHLVSVERSPKEGVESIPMIAEREIEAFMKKYQVLPALDQPGANAGSTMQIPLTSDGAYALYAAV